MSERMSAWIALGGKVPRARVEALCQVLAAEQLASEWGGPAEPFRTAAQLRRCLDADGHLWLCDDEASWGRFPDLETYCQKEGIAYDRHHSSKYEHDAELVRFRPGHPLQAHLASEDGEILLRASEVRKQLDACTAGSITLLQLQERLLPVLPELPPFILE